MKGMVVVTPLGVSVVQDFCLLLLLRSVIFIYSNFCVLDSLYDVVLFETFVCIMGGEVVGLL